jgi:hypothetical protein
MDTEVRMLRSSSTRAIVGMDSSFYNGRPALAAGAGRVTPPSDCALLMA